jgi:hypothetical protein
MNGPITVAAALQLAAELYRSRMDHDEPKPGDLVVEVTSLRAADPDSIGWLIGHDLAPYKEDDPLDGSVPMREVWDVLPLNPDAVLQRGGYQRWVNAEFRRVPDALVKRLGLTKPEALR